MSAAEALGDRVLTRVTSNWIEQNPELLRLLIEARKKPLILRRLLRIGRAS